MNFKKRTTCYLTWIAFVILFLILNLSLQAQIIQEKKNFESQYDVIDDSFPKPSIGLKPVIDGKDIYLFVFYDSKGRVVKELTDRELPEYSKYKTLDFPKVNDSGKVIKYNLSNLPFTDRKATLQKSEIIDVPDEVIKDATEIDYFGTEVAFKEGDNFIITKATIRFLIKTAEGNAYWDQTHISIFDNSGENIRQLDVNHVVSDVVISHDARYLLVIMTIYHQYDADTYDIPFKMFDFLSNKVENIDLTREYSSIEPIYMLYADSFFQLLLGAGSNNLHVLLDPVNKKMYLKYYNENKFKFLGNGGKFNSMHLPDGNKIEIDDYKMISY